MNRDVRARRRGAAMAAAALALAVPAMAADNAATAAARTAYESAVRQYGPDSEAATAAEIKLGGALLDQGDRDEAMQHLGHARAAIEARRRPRAPATTAELGAAFAAARREFGPDSGQAVAAEAAFAQALSADDRLAEALPHLEHVRTVVARELGPNSPPALMTSAGLAMALVNGGDPTRAEAIARDTLDRARAAGREQSPSATLAKAALGSVLSLRGRYAEAYPFLKAAHDGMASVFGAGALEVRQIGAVLENVTAGLGYDAEALTLRRRLAEAPPPGAPEAVALLAMFHQVQVLNAQDRSTEALAVGAPLVARLSALRGAGHTSTLDAMAAVARAQASLENWTEAARLMRLVYDGYVRASGPDDLFTLDRGELLGYYQLRSEHPQVRAAGRALMARLIEQRRALQGPNAAKTVMATVILARWSLEDPAADRAQIGRWLEQADAALKADPSQAGGAYAVSADTLIGRFLIDRGHNAEAYGRFARAARVARARSNDQRVAAGGLDALGELTRFRFVFLDQVRAGWSYAHDP